MKLKEFLGSILYKYYHGKNHPTKLRIFNLFRKYILKDYRIIIPYYNQKISLNLNDYVDLEIFTKGDYEKHLLNSLLEHIDIKKKHILWDIGAHIGSFSIKTSTIECIKEIHSFEPNPLTFKVTKINQSLNNNKFKTYNFGLGTICSASELYVPLTNNTGGASLIYDENIPNIKVNVKIEKGDEILTKYKISSPTVIKIDVEGFEYEVIKGLENIFINSKPDIIILETKANLDGKINDLRIVDFLNKFNYLVKTLDIERIVYSDILNFIAIVR